MKPLKVYLYLIFIISIFVFLLHFSGSVGCGGGSSGSVALGYGDITGGVVLENLTTSKSFDSNASISVPKLTSSTQRYVTLNNTNLKYLAASSPQIKYAIDSSVSGTASLIDLEGNVIETSDFNGEFSFTNTLEGTYLVKVVIAKPTGLANLMIKTFVDVSAGGTTVAVPNPLSTVVVEKAIETGNEHGIVGDSLNGFNLSMMISIIDDCFGSQYYSKGIDDKLEASNLADSNGIPYDLATIADMFEDLPDSCKTLGYTSFARGKLLAAGKDFKKVTQALGEIFLQLGFIVMPDQHESVLTETLGDYAVENYCQDPQGCDGSEEWKKPLDHTVFVPTSFEKNRNHPDDDPWYWLPMISEYRIKFLAQAYVDDLTVTATQIHRAIVDKKGLWMSLCFESGFGSQYCFDTDGKPALNMVYGPDHVDPLLDEDDIQEPSCAQILPILCDPGETIDTFAAKTINMATIKEDIIFQRIHLDHNITGGPNLWVVFDGWDGNKDSKAVKVNINRGDDFEITSVVQSEVGKYYLTQRHDTSENGTIGFIKVDDGRWVSKDNGEELTYNIDNVILLEGVSVKETGSNIYGGSVIINDMHFGVVGDGWQAGSSPIEVYMTYENGQHSAAQIDEGATGTPHYLMWNEDTHEKAVVNFLNSENGQCVLDDPSDEESEANPCLEGALGDIIGLFEHEYRDMHTYIFNGTVDNPLYDREADPYFDDLPDTGNLCNIDADGDGKQDPGDGILCTKTLLDKNLCDALEDTFSWHIIHTNLDAPYSVHEDYYRWAESKQFVRFNGEEDEGEVQTIACGDSFDWRTLPPHPDDNQNLIPPENTPGDSFDYMKTPAQNGLVPRNFRALANAYAVGRPNAITNLASLAFGGHSTVGPTTEFNIIEAFAMIYTAISVDTNVTVAGSLLLEDALYDHETMQYVDLELIDEMFHATFYQPWMHKEGEHKSDYQRILEIFGISEDYLHDKGIY